MVRKYYVVINKRLTSIGQFSFFLFYLTINAMGNKKGKLRMEYCYNTVDQGFPISVKPQTSS